MDKQVPKVKEPLMAKDDPERTARLAQALRDNLRRRKAQSRDQAVRESTPVAPRGPLSEP